MKVIFAKIADFEYKQWSINDERVFDRINRIIDDILRSPFSGIGKPEQLKHKYTGYWSRRIDSKNRIVYRFIDDETIEIARCKGHYGDK